MYLAVAVIESTGAPAGEDGLRRALVHSRTQADRLDHVMVEHKGSRVLVALYLAGGDRPDATVAADQLCRRAMVSWCGSTRWQLRSCQAKQIGPSKRPP
jgi:hypothetical protein